MDWEVSQNLKTSTNVPIGWWNQKCRYTNCSLSSLFFEQKLTLPCFVWKSVNFHSHIYIYIYIERERERDCYFYKEWAIVVIEYIYIYIYIYVRLVYTQNGVAQSAGAVEYTDCTFVEG